MDELLVGPAWLGKERFDISGKLDAADIEAWKSLSYGQRRERVRPLLQKMLSDRFGLVLHSTTVEASIYGLFLAAREPKLKESATNQQLPPDTHPVELAAMAQGEGIVVPFTYGGKPEDLFFATPMNSLASFISTFSDRIVEDKTGLTGKYDFTLRILDLPSDPTVPDGSSGPDLRPPTAFDLSALGLTLRATKGPVEKWIIDHIDRPTAN